MELESEQQGMDRPQEMSWYQMAKVWLVLGYFAYVSVFSFLSGLPCSAHSQFTFTAVYKYRVGPCLLRSAL